MAKNATTFLCLCALLLVFAPFASAQEVEVEGRVTEAESGFTLPGVNIAVQGTQIGTTTDLDGRYEITVPGPDAVLVFSFVGFEQQEIRVGNQTRIDVALRQSVAELEDVVVVGYGTQRKRDLTGSVSSVDVAEANVGQITSAQELIQGRVPGINIVKNNGEPGAGMTIRVRGGTSISASNDPLFVIDGVPINNASTEPGAGGVNSSGPRNPLNMLNPNDIESIDILKDASAAAIYGARGANGVIMITTKSGRAGMVTVDYDGYASSSSPYRTLDLLSASQYRDFVNRYGLGNDLGGANTDWQDELYRNAITHSHNLAIGGGTENTTYRASVGYMDQEGIVISSGLERLTGRINANHRAWDDNLRIGLNLTSSHVTDDKIPYQQTGGFSGGLFTNMMKFNPTFPVTDGNAFFEYPTPSIRNPIGMARQIDDLVKSTRTLGNLTAELELVEGLTGRVNVGVDRSNARRFIFIPRASPVGSPVGGEATQRQRDLTSSLIETTLNYNNTVAGGHTFTVLGGYSWQQFTTEQFGATMRDFVTDAWGFNNLSGGADNSIKPDSWKEQSKLISFFGRLNYDYKGKYLLTGTIRRDGSTRFGAGNKWGWFPSASLAWRLSEEAFVRDMTPFTNLKLRVSYGITGSQEIGNYRSLSTLAPNQGFIWIKGEDEVEVTGVAPNNFANPNLQWEETASFNTGLDYGFANGKISGAIDFYIKNTNNLLIEFDVPQPAVVSTRLENIGEVRNTGLEFSLEALAVDRRDFNVTLGGNFSTNKNEVLNLGGRDRIITGTVSGAGLSGVNSQIITEGEPIGTFYGPVFLGFENGEQQFVLDEFGNRERQIIGNAQPDFTYGAHANINYNNWDLSLFLRGDYGRDVFNNLALEYTSAFLVNTNVNFLGDALDDTCPPGQTGGNCVALENSSPVFSSRWVEDGSFLRLDNVTLGYTFNEIPGVSSSYMRRARVYLSAQNLLVVTPYDGYDPEVNTDAGLATLGIDYTNYPRPRTFTLGLNLGF